MPLDIPLKDFLPIMVIYEDNLILIIHGVMDLASHRCRPNITQWWAVVCDHGLFRELIIKASAMWSLLARSKLWVRVMFSWLPDVVLRVCLITNITVENVYMHSHKWERDGPFPTNSDNIVKLQKSCRTANRSVLDFWNLVCRQGNTARRNCI